MTERFRDRWQRLQMDFVDDPQTAAGLAGALVDEVVTALHDAVDRQRSELEEWRSGRVVDVHPVSKQIRDLVLRLAAENPT